MAKFKVLAQTRDGELSASEIEADFYQVEMNGFRFLKRLGEPTDDGRIPAEDLGFIAFPHAVQVQKIEN